MRGGDEVIRRAKRFSIRFQWEHLPRSIEGDHFDYRWTGGPMPAVLKLIGVGGALTQA
jgi:hypothetical protein